MDKNQLFSIVVVAVALLIIWGGFMWYLINYGESVKENPISFATKKLKINCVCTSPKIPNAFLFSNSEGKVSYDHPEIVSDWEGYVKNDAG